MWFFKNKNYFQQNFVNSQTMSTKWTPKAVIEFDQFVRNDKWTWRLEMRAWVDKLCEKLLIWLHGDKSPWSHWLFSKLSKSNWKYCFLRFFWFFFYRHVVVNVCFVAMCLDGNFYMFNIHFNIKIVYLVSI
jgi:hypothetical protein